MKHLVKSTFNSLLLLLFLSIVFPLTALADTPNKSKAVTFKNNKYQICFEKVSPAKQQELCKKAGGHLVTITSKEENNFIKMLINYKGKGFSYFVIGGTDYGHEGKWTWVTGEKWSYHNWAKGEPNNGSSASNTSQDYTYISSKDGLWRDFYGKKYYTVIAPYICEWDNTSVAVTGVNINKTSASGHVGDSISLSASVSPSNAISTAVKWSSSNTKVASVDNNGKVKFLATGSATIRATSVANSSKSATCTVKVTEKTRKVSKITISGATGIYPGTSVQLKLSISPSNATNKKVTWTSSNTNIATVSDSGLVKGKKSGTVTITAAAKDGSKIKASCKIKVGIRVKTLKANTKDLLLVKGKSSQIKMKISPSNASNKKLKWKTGNAKVAKVSSSGVVKAVGPGTTTITVSTTDGSKKKVSIKVTIVSKPLKMSTGSITVKYTNKTKEITLTNAPNDVKWTSSNTRVVTVTPKNKKSAKAVLHFGYAGSATVTASFKGRKYNCKVTVRPYISSTTIKAPCTVQRKKVALFGAENKVKWQTSNKDVVTISTNTRNGNTAFLTFRHVGKAKITAKYAGKTYTCNVTVTPVYTKESYIPYGNASGSTPYSNVRVNTYNGAKTFSIFKQYALGDGMMNAHGCGYCAGATLARVYGKTAFAGVAPKNITPQSFYYKSYPAAYPKIGTKGNGINVGEINQIFRLTGIKSARYVTGIPRSKAAAYLKKELYSGHPMIIHASNPIANSGRHVVVALGMTEKGNVIVGNSNAKAINGRTIIQLLKPEFLAQYMLESGDNIDVAVLDAYGAYK